MVFVCAIKADGPLDSHKFSSGSLKGWHQIDLVEAKNSLDKIMEFQLGKNKLQCIINFTKKRLLTPGKRTRQRGTH